MFATVMLVAVAEALSIPSSTQTEDDAQYMPLTLAETGQLSQMGPEIANARKEELDDDRGHMEDEKFH